MVDKEKLRQLGLLSLQEKRLKGDGLTSTTCRRVLVTVF